MAGEELGLEDLVRVEHVVVDTDAYSFWKSATTDGWM